MLIEFSVANFRSFRDRVTLSLEAEPRVRGRDEAVDARNVSHTAHGDLLRVVGIYGANAGGKSNLLGALATLRSLVINSAREGQAGDVLPARPFRLDAASLGEPSELEIVFIHGDEQVRYGVAFTAIRVEREWLFVRAAGSAQEERWFERTQDRYERGGAWVHDPGLERKTRAEALHLSVAAAWNHAQGQRLLEWFQVELRVINGSSEDRAPTATIRLLEDPDHRESICALIRRLDFGIDDLQVWAPSERELAEQQLFDPPVFRGGKLALSARAMQRLVAIRQGVSFDLKDDESAGTAKAVALAGPIVHVLAHATLQARLPQERPAAVRAVADAPGQRATARAEARAGASRRAARRDAARRGKSLHSGPSAGSSAQRRDPLRSLQREGREDVVLEIRVVGGVAADAGAVAEGVAVDAVAVFLVPVPAVAGAVHGAVLEAFNYCGPAF